MNPTIIALFEKLAAQGIDFLLPELETTLVAILGGTSPSEAFKAAGMRLAEREAIALDNITAPKP